MQKPGRACVKLIAFAFGCVLPAISAIADPSLRYVNKTIEFEYVDHGTYRGLQTGREWSTSSKVTYSLYVSSKNHVFERKTIEALEGWNDPTRTNESVLSLGEVGAGQRWSFGKAESLMWRFEGEDLVRIEGGSGGATRTAVRIARGRNDCTIDVRDVKLKDSEHHLWGQGKYERVSRHISVSYCRVMLRNRLDEGGQTTQ